DGIRDLIVTGVQTCALPISTTPTTPPPTTAPPLTTPTTPSSPPTSTTGIASWPAGKSAYTLVLISAKSRRQAYAKAREAKSRGKIGRASCREREKIAAGARA